MRTSIETVRSMLMQMRDPEYYSHLYGMQCYAVGGSYAAAKHSAMGGGDFPDYPPIQPEWYKVGQSRRLLNNQALMMMKVCYHDPEPDFPDIPEIHEEVRRSWVKNKWKSHNYGDEDWGYECIRAFLDGDGLGIGAVQIGVKDRRTCLQFHPATNVLWDRHQYNPHRSRCAAIIHYLPVEDAVDQFGSDVKAYQSAYLNDGSLNPLPCVKIIEYFDIGIGKSEPTHCFIAQGIQGPVLDHVSNDFGCIPISFYTHWHPYILKRPLGRIDLQLSSQEMRNSLERYIKGVLERGSGFDLLNTVGMNEQDLCDLLEGVLLPVIKYDGDDSATMQGKVNRIPPQDIPSGVFNFLAMIDRDQNTESGNSDADRSNITSKSRTLGEINQAQAGADIQTAWSQRQFARFLQDVIGKTVKIGAKFETAPSVLDVHGVNYPVNVPTDPNSNLEFWLQEDSRVVVSEDNLLYKSNQQKRAEMLQAWMGMISDPGSNPLEVRRKIYEAMGERNPDTFISPQLVQMSEGTTGQAQGFPTMG